MASQTLAKSPEPVESEIPESETVALNCQDVRKRFGQTQALDGVSFSVAQGERVALLGPNGAGKTSLIRAITGRVRLDSGNIEVFSKSVTSTEGARMVGVVPQEIAVYPDLTTRENLQVFGRLNGLGRRQIRQKVDEMLVWIDLVERADDLVRTFSGGMKRRVNLACGVMHSPALLLLDEPTVGVDPQSRQRIFDMLDELNRNGMTLVLTTHHLDEAEQQSDRIVIVDHGKVIAHGTLPELIEKTIGNRRQVAVQLESAGQLELEDWTLDPNGKFWLGEVEDLVRDLPPLLRKMERSGCAVTHMEIRSPNLHHVFLHLTGRELRE